MSSWHRQPHPIWGKGGKEEHIHTLGLTFTFPKYQWKQAHLSIISPSSVSMDRYELYDGKEIYRFETLKEAKAYGEQLLKEKQ